MLKQSGNALVAGEVVKLRSFATFAPRSKGPRPGRNPRRPDQVVTIEPRRVVISDLPPSCATRSMAGLPSPTDPRQLRDLVVGEPAPDFEAGLWQRCGCLHKSASCCLQSMVVPSGVSLRKTSIQAPQVAHSIVASFSG